MPCVKCSTLKRTLTLGPLDPFTIFVAKSSFIIPKIHKKIKQQKKKKKSIQKHIMRKHIIVYLIKKLVN